MDDAAVLGLPAEDVQRVAERVERDDVDFEVWPENWPVVGLFLELATQWSWAGTMGGLVVTGIRYDAVQALFQMRGVRRWAGAYLDDLQAMERAAMPILNERKP